MAKKNYITDVELTTILDIFLKNEFDKGLDFLHHQFKDNFLNFSTNFQLAESIIKKYKNCTPLFKKKINAIFWKDFAYELDSLDKTKTSIPNLLEKYKILYDAEQVDYLKNCLNKLTQPQEVTSLVEYVLSQKNSVNRTTALSIIGQHLPGKYWSGIPNNCKHILSTHPDIVLGMFYGCNIDLIKNILPLQFDKQKFANFYKDNSVESLTKDFLKKYKPEIQAIKKDKYGLGYFNKTDFKLVPFLLNTSNNEKGIKGRIDKGQCLIELMKHHPELFNYSINGHNFAYDVINSELLDINGKQSLLTMFKTLPTYHFNPEWAFTLARSGEFPIIITLVKDLGLDLNYTSKKEKLKDYFDRKFNKNSNFSQLISAVEKRDLLLLNSVKSNTTSIKTKLL